MPPTYTITAADVAAVSGNSALVEGTRFDWGSTPKKIHPPASVSLVNAQWIVDHCRFAEDRDVAMGRPSILTASGKIQTGTNPVTGNPELTSITPVLQDDWVIETLKSSGTFVIEDVYNPTYTQANGVPPYINVAGVDIRYVVTRNSTIQQINAGQAGGDATAANQTAILAAITDLNDLSSADVTAAIDLTTIESNIGLILADTNAIRPDALIARKGVSNRHLIDEATNTGTLYDDDGTTPLYVFDLFGSDGAVNSEQVYERRPQ